MVLKLVIDTDVGSDDAMALVLCAAARARGEVEILGITCVHGNTSLDNVCVNTLKTLHTLEQLDIPVFRGSAESLVQTMDRASHIHGSDGFGDFEYPNAPDVNSSIQKKHAVNFLIDIVKENPGEVTLLTLAPLTNIALAIRMDPVFCHSVKELIIMGGNVEGVGNASAAAEFNFFCDPEAAYVTLHNMNCPITIFPWETAYKYGSIPYTWRKGVLGQIDSPQAKLMTKVERNLLEKELYGAWGRCDPYAAALTINPKIVTKKTRHFVTVELQGQTTKGLMVIDHFSKLGQQPNVMVVERVDVELYKEMLVEAFSYKPKNLS